MSVFRINSRVIRKNISLLFVNNVRRGLVFIWCSINVILFQLKTLFFRSCNRFVSVHRHQCSCLHSCEKMAENGTTLDNLNTKNGNFICGVVEGEFSVNWMYQCLPSPNSLLIWFFIQHVFLKSIKSGLSHL
jgi:hypothetical protein